MQSDRLRRNVDQHLHRTGASRCSSPGHREARSRFSPGNAGNRGSWRSGRRAVVGLLGLLLLLSGAKGSQAAEEKSPPAPRAQDKPEAEPKEPPKSQNAASTAITKNAEGIKHVALFDESDRPDSWSVNFGQWEVERGVLVARELAKDEHAAASRWRIPLTDGLVRLKLKLAGAKMFHLGFDPAPGQLKTKGHLYTLMISPGQAVIKKHRDKLDDASRDVTLATAQADELAADVWLPVELEAKGNQVRVQIGQGVKLEATDPSFHVAKPAVVFRVIGGDVHLDDVEVTVRPPAAAR